MATHMISWPTQRARLLPENIPAREYLVVTDGVTVYQGIFSDLADKAAVNSPAPRTNHILRTKPASIEKYLARFRNN